MAKRPRRNHSPAFKAKVALAAVKGDKTLVELSEYFDIHANQITQWKTQLLERARDAFDGAGSKEPPIDVKTLHAKIGELALENDFLEGALTKAGLLSAKR
jgi:transposase